MTNLVIWSLSLSTVTYLEKLIILSNNVSILLLCIFVKCASYHSWCLSCFSLEGVRRLLLFNTNFIFEPNKWWFDSKRTDNDQLLGLSGSYHRHAIGTFNTCSRGPIERSSTDLGGGYNLGGTSLSHTHSLTFPTSCLHFPLMAPSGLHFNPVLATNPKFEF
jgi:hypothetical protein